MSLDTYANLKTAIADTLDRDDLSDNIDDFIDLAEEMHRRPPESDTNRDPEIIGGVRLKEMITRSSITVNARQISLPTRYLEAINFRLLTTPVTVLKAVNYHEMTRIRTSATGKPQYFTVANEIELDKSPDSSYSGEIVYYQYPTPLDATNTTNDVLTYAPGAYLYGALLASAPFLMDDPRIVMWRSLYRASAKGVSALTRKGRVVGPLVSRVSGPTP